MKKHVKLFAFILSVSISVNVFATNNKGVTLEKAQANFLEHVDTDYSFQLAKRLETYKSNEVWGYRTAGSKAELLTGDLLVEEMKAIGLEDVTKDAITVDTWEFEKAKLTYKDSKGYEHVFHLGGYATEFDTQGEKAFELVYAGKGTAADYENLDVEGKLVLLDMNQRDEWWINYPAYQAHLKGATAVIVAQEAGYSEVGQDALNTQDICGPEDAPAFSISNTHANILKAALMSDEDGVLKVDFDAKSTVGRDGTTYNIVGTIPGKDPDSMVLLSAHYDSYYSGFQDDNAAIALMLGIAKSVRESGYQPEKTLVFCAMAAEEWGKVNTRYDWSTGAYNQVFKAHPEWVGKVVADINFELPAYAHGSTSNIRSIYEYNTFLSDFVKKVPAVEGAFEDGIKVVSPIQTWSDDFSMSIAGIPSMRNDFEGTFMEKRYHSQYDDDTIYNEAVFLFHHNLYGMLLLEYDRLAVAPLDFSVTLEALKESIDDSLLGEQGIKTDALMKAIDEAIVYADEAYEKVEVMNKAYREALDKGDDERAQTIYQETRAINASLLAIFKEMQDDFTRLTWEDATIFPHENSQNNLMYALEAIKYLEAGDVAAALDESIISIDNNWYAHAFDQQVFEYFTNYVLDQPADRLMWGSGRVMGHEDLFDVVKSLLNKYDQESPETTKEITRLKQVVENQKTSLTKVIKEETTEVKQLTQAIKKVTTSIK